MQPMGDVVEMKVDVSPDHPAFDQNEAHACNFAREQQFYPCSPSMETLLLHAGTLFISHAWGFIVHRAYHTVHRTRQVNFKN